MPVVAASRWRKIFSPPWIQLNSMPRPTMGLVRSRWQRRPRMILSTDQISQAPVALSRFGLGAKPGGISRIGADAKAAVLAELDTPGIADITAAGLPTYQDACQAIDTDFNVEYNMCQAE